MVINESGYRHSADPFPGPARRLDSQPLTRVVLAKSGKSEH